MRKKADIPTVELLQLQTAGWSQARLAIHFGCSKKTIKRRLRSLAEQKDKSIMEFAKLLADVGSTAPAGYCRDEVLRLVNTIRTHHALPENVKKNRIVDSIRSGAREVDEIAEDCQLSRDEADEFLSQLIVAGRVTRRARGGVQNRGRRMKFHYFISVNCPQKK